VFSQIGVDRGHHAESSVFPRGGLPRIDHVIDPEADADAVADVLLAISRGIDVLGHGGLRRERLERAVEAALTAFAA
jgi:hypothetical protein